jgi:Methyltransferase domain
MDLRERTTSSSPRHPWEQSRAAFFSRMVTEIHPKARPARVLDVGSGDGWLASQLSTRLPGAEVVCWDINYTADDLIGLATTYPRLSLTANPPTGQFDLILMLDVIEHVEEPEALLTSIAAEFWARPGTLIVSVPAYQSLFSQHDAALGHHRRYSPRELRELITGCGLNVRDSGSFFTSLLPPRAAASVIERGRSVIGDGHADSDQLGVGAWNHGPVITSAVTSLLNADWRVSWWLAQRGVGTPGLSTWVICENEAE